MDLSSELRVPAVPAAGERLGGNEVARRLVIGAALLWLAGWIVVFGLPGVREPGGDYLIYREVGSRVLAGGPLYEPHQLAGPYVTAVGDSMYPPTTAPLFVAFAALPEPLARFLWYVIPLAIVGWVIFRRLRPTGWALALTLVLLVVPPSIQTVYFGNPVLWVVAAIALSTLYRWPAIFVLLKPSLFPFALLGLRDRWGWVVLAGFAVVSLALLPLTLQWLTAIANARGTFSGPFYSLLNVPLLMAPLVAWLGRTRTAGA